MGTSCNNTTGICEAGCQEHWGEPKCDGNFFFNVPLMIMKPDVLKQTTTVENQQLHKMQTQIMID